MSDPRTDLYNVLSRRLTEEMVARDEAWADYWQRRRVVVVPDDPGPPGLIKNLARDLGGKVEHVSGPLSDGSGFATISYPLPKDHWIYSPGPNVPPMSFRTGTDSPRRNGLGEKVRAAARYAVRASTMNGKETDFDPDAMVQNFVIGMLGYHTPNGLSDDDWANPPQMQTAPGSAEQTAPPYARNDEMKHNAEMIAAAGDIQRNFSGLEHTNVYSGWAPVVRDCIARLKAARDKDAVNKNLSTLLAVVVKVQRDLEVLLNGSTPR